MGWFFGWVERYLDWLSNWVSSLNTLYSGIQTALNLVDNRITGQLQAQVSTIQAALSEVDQRLTGQLQAQVSTIQAALSEVDRRLTGQLQAQVSALYTTINNEALLRETLNRSLNSFMAVQNLNIQSLSQRIVNIEGVTAQMGLSLSSLATVLGVPDIESIGLGMEGLRSSVLSKITERTDFLRKEVFDLLKVRLNPADIFMRSVKAPEYKYKSLTKLRRAETLGSLREGVVNNISKPRILLPKMLPRKTTDTGNILNKALDLVKILGT